MTKKKKLTKGQVRRIKSNQEKKLLNKKGPYIVTAGYPAGIPGGTNTIKILNENEINYYLSLK